jgi:hypothetical protein
MSIQAAAKEVFVACRAVGEELDVNFDANEITIYWENLRLDVQPKDLGKALKVIKDAKALGAWFE